MNTRICTALAALCVSGCVASPSPETAPTTATAVAAPAPPVLSGAQIAPGRWNVEQVRCSDLLEASDADRAAAAMFYYGYLAARAGIRVIDVSRIDGNIANVMRQCAAEPALTVPQAFRAALRPGAARG
ncbi:MAG TPA: HdeA/HdeB family chaperone [Stellaceae bacterium]|nr:HdeA/HdeB family chaperone [Stellaceae bacterium]